jgi:hypothetical protein
MELKLKITRKEDAADALRSIADDADECVRELRKHFLGIEYEIDKQRSTASDLYMTLTLPAAFDDRALDEARIVETFHARGLWAFTTFLDPLAAHLTFEERLSALDLQLSLANKQAAILGKSTAVLVDENKARRVEGEETFACVAALAIAMLRHHEGLAGTLETVLTELGDKFPDNKRMGILDALVKESISSGPRQSQTPSDLAATKLRLVPRNADRAEDAPNSTS